MSVDTARGVGAFLTRVSDAVVDLAASGLRLAFLGVEPRRELQFVASPSDSRLAPSTTELTTLFPLALVPESGEFASNAERRRAFWQPAATAPAHLHLAWLSEDLAGWSLEFVSAGLKLRSVECPTHDYTDVVVDAPRGPVPGTYRMRIRLSGRTEPLEYPSMFMRDILTEGSFARWLVSGAVSELDGRRFTDSLVDLRDEI